MVLVRYVFGIMLLAVAIYLLSRLLPDAVTLALWAALSLLTAAVLFFGARGEATAPRISRGRLAISAGAAAYAVVLAVGAATGASDPLRPLAGIGRGEHVGLAFQRVKSVEELDRVIAAANREGRSVMLDFYADWCVSCKEMERDTFTDPGVHDALDRAVLVQADVTAYDADDQALLARFRAARPTGDSVLRGTDGRERREFRVIGFMNAASFQPHVARSLSRTGRPAAEAGDERPSFQESFDHMAVPCSLQSLKTRSRFPSPWINPPMRDRLLAPGEPE